MKIENRKAHGFTLLELIIVIAIISIIASIILLGLGDSREKARDAKRKTESQEVIKALELYYSDNDQYPQYLNSSPGSGFLSNINSSFYGAGLYISELPSEADSRFYYCVSADRKSILLAIDTDQDLGSTGSEYCRIERGSDPTSGCDAAITNNSTDLCSERF